MVHQAYLEPHACLASFDPLQQELTVWTGTQWPFMVRDAVAGLLGFDRHQVRVVPLTVGGGFGAKFGTVEPLVAAAAVVHLGAPVRMVLDRGTDFLTTTPAPACTLEVETGATRAGDLNALRARVTLDSGAFPTGQVSIVCTLLASYYRFPNLDVVGYEVVTNKPMAGSYRAPGAPQATFAIESQIDELARELDMDPLEVRLRNAFETGGPDARRRALAEHRPAGVLGAGRRPPALAGPGRHRAGPAQGRAGVSGWPPGGRWGERCRPRRPAGPTPTARSTCRSAASTSPAPEQQWR